jgi:hypothetical protein
VCERYCSSGCCSDVGVYPIEILSFIIYAVSVCVRESDREREIERVRVSACERDRDRV